jgi:hypothetical protein
MMTLFGEPPGLLLNWVIYIGWALCIFWGFYFGWQTSAWLNRNGYYKFLEVVADAWTPVDSLVLSLMIGGLFICVVVAIWRAFS